MPAGKKAARGIQSGNWSHVPHGCSLLTGGDYTTHWSYRKATSNKDFSPICEYADKKVDDVAKSCSGDKFTFKCTS